MPVSLKKVVTLLLVGTLTACAAPTPSTSLPPTTSVRDTSMSSTATAVPPTATPTPNLLAVQVVVDDYIGEGKYRVTGESSGLETIHSYEFLITFRANADGAIVGEGVLTKVEESMGGSANMSCNRPGVSSVTFPPMKVKGTVKPDATGQPDATFQLTIAALGAVLPPQMACVKPQPYSYDAPASDGGFILSDIEIAATDGAQANGEDSSEMEILGTSVTQVTTWELQIHRQETP